MEYPMIHICYRVMDLQASEKFYQDALGFEVSRKKDYPDGRFTLSYMTSANLPFELELTYNYDQEQPYEMGNGYSHLAVGTTDLEASHKRHTDMGLKVTPLKGLVAGKPRFYFITDPDGFLVEVVRNS